MATQNYTSEVAKVANSKSLKTFEQKVAKLVDQNEEFKGRINNKNEINKCYIQFLMMKVSLLNFHFQNI